MSSVCGACSSSCPLMTPTTSTTRDAGLRKVNASLIARAASALPSQAATMVPSSARLFRQRRHDDDRAPRSEQAALDQSVLTDQRIAVARLAENGQIDMAGGAREVVRELLAHALHESPPPRSRRPLWRAPRRPAARSRLASSRSPSPRTCRRSPRRRRRAGAARSGRRRGRSDARHAPWRAPRQSPPGPWLPRCCPHRRECH